MQVSVESPSAIERKITVEVPAERIDQEVDQRLKSMVGRVRIDGFRPGKVPFKVVKQRYGQDVFNEVVGQVLQSTFQEAVTQEKLRPAGSPEIEAMEAEPGKPLNYTAKFEVYPEFDVGPVDALEITRPVAEIAESDMDKMIENLRQQRKEFEAVDRASQNGDRITIDYEGFIDGEAFEGGKAENAQIELGAGRLIESLESQLVGLNPGEEKTLDVVFPEDYHAEQLKGKTTQFKVKVNEVAEAKLPELTDEFIAQFGITEGGVDAFRDEVRKNMQRELDGAVSGRIKQQVMDGLFDSNDVPVPEALVKEEIQRMRQQTAQQMGAQGMDGSMFPDDLFEGEARKRVALGLIIGEIVRQNEIKLDRDKVDAKIKEFAASYEDPEQVEQFYRTNPQAMAGVEAMALEEQVVDWVLEKAKVSDEKTDFESLMNPNPKKGDE
jgi:trigger factor